MLQQGPGSNSEAGTGRGTSHDDKHYLSDVIFGGAMGIAAERTVTLHAGRYGMMLTPLAGGGRAGVLAVVRPR